MAKELNLGVDSFAFIDDDPFQRNMIREFLPEVAVFHPNRLKDYIGFSSLVITEEDKNVVRCMCRKDRGMNSRQP